MYKYLIIINTISFILMGLDKYKAIHKKYRIPESYLLLLSWIGGGIGSFIGMIIFHHKTKKIKFLLLIPLSILILVFLVLK